MAKVDKSPTPNVTEVPEVPQSDAPNEGISRRGFVKGAVAGAAAVGGLGSLAAKTEASNRGPTMAPNYDGREELWLVNRTTMGYTREDWELAKSLGYEGWLEYQLDHQNIDDSETDEWLSAFETLELNNEELWRRHRRAPERPRNELRKATIYRAINSKRQLFERMVHFWTDHFTIFHDKEHCQLFKTSDDRDVIRAHALGKFPDMVAASARSSAMCWYLDNHLSDKESPNENYARELMELHTLGVDGPYREHDVKNVARCFTGWTIQFDPDPQPGEWEFDPVMHDEGQKVVLGHVIPEGGGESDGNRVLDILTQHPKTADFVSRKMCRWLLGYKPSEAVVQATVATYLRTGGSIKDMIRVIFAKNTLNWQKNHYSGAWTDLKYKRPIHAVASFLRALRPTVYRSAMNPLLTRMERMGMVPFQKQTPDGYADGRGDWSGSPLPRWLFMADLLDDRITGIFVDHEGLHERMGLDINGAGGAQGISPRAYAQGINLLLNGGAMDPRRVARLQQYLDENGTDWPVLKETIAMAAFAPTFSYY